ncbi:MAG TPA: sugar transferase [Patescibacteria group bacterium]|jgi:exopolysaccharide biosynthesis polyprenyl glycosylphosphotransferase|nr:sugar transferase [Patescibacteria group bacterium]
MKRTELLFNLISIPVDILMLATAGIVSFYLRLHSEQYLGPVHYNLQLHDFILVLAKVIPLLLLVFALLGLYKLRGTRRFIHEFNRIFVGTSLGMLFAIVLFFFDQSIFPSRFIILTAWALGIVFILFGRIVLKRIQEAAFRFGYGLHRLIVIDGSGSEAGVIENFLSNKSHGYKVVGELPNDDSAILKLEDILKTTGIDEIMQSNPHATSDQNLALLQFARKRGLQFSFVPNLFEVQRNVIELDNFKGIPIIKLKNTPLEGWGKVIKRLLDIVASLICLIITAPLSLVIYIAVRLNSPGPGIYKHVRSGYKKEFQFYKFRSMFTHLSTGKNYGDEKAAEVLHELLEQVTDEDRSGPLWKIKDDPRITSVGKFLRKTKLDEIPQFWNVLIGNMSMIGPRPHMPEQVEKYRQHYGRVFSIKPGIFGLTQIAQLTRPNLPFEEEIRLDTYYIENWSLIWDIKIIIKSFYMLLFTRKPNDSY